MYDTHSLRLPVCCNNKIPLAVLAKFSKLSRNVSSQTNLQGEVYVVIISLHLITECALAHSHQNDNGHISIKDILSQQNVDIKIIARDFFFDGNLR